MIRLILNSLLNHIPLKEIFIINFYFIISLYW